jgi:hypothetical protein
MRYEMSMDFCPSCGRQWAASDRFCGGCGAAYPERQDLTRVDVPAEVTRTDTPAAARPADDPFASWFAQDSPPAAPSQPEPPVPPAPQAPGGQSGWSPTQTLYVAPGSQGGSYPPPPPPSQAGPVYPQALGPRRSGGKRAAFFLVALVVVAGAGVGAYKLVSMAGQSSTSQPPTASSPAAAATRAGSTSPASPAGSGTTSATATTSPTGSASFPGGVALGPGVTAGKATTRAQAVLAHYFHGINTHDYTEYASVLDAGRRAAQPESSFNAGYGSTRDSGMTLTSLADTGGGELAATVTFTSHQDPAQSIDGSACNNWTLTLYLAPQGDGSYLITHAPVGYHAAHSDC